MKAQLQQVRDNNLTYPGAQTWPTWSFVTSNNDEWAQSRVLLTSSVVGYTITAEAAMRVHQLRTNTPRRRPPTLMLVLDYSNSMNRSSASFGVAITQLRTVVTNFLDILPQDDFLVGAVTYGTGVYDVVQPASRRNSADFTAIRQVVARAASGDTNTGAGLQAALGQILAQPENFGRNILLVSDGEPCCESDSEASALAAAATARANEVQVITIEVHHVASGGHMHDVLVQISGNDLALHFEAENAAVLDAQFQGVRARPLCDIEVPGGLSNDAYVYLWRAAGDEIPLRRLRLPSEISCPDNCDTYGFRFEGPRVILSPIACEQIYAGQRTALVRWGGPTLSL
jgi:uncharacterized protein YegL